MATVLGFLATERSHLHSNDDSLDSVVCYRRACSSGAIGVTRVVSTRGGGAVVYGARLDRERGAVTHRLVELLCARDADEARDDLVNSEPSPPCHPSS
jgi:hypothetical protein